MAASPKEKCIWCNGAEGELTTVELPIGNQFPAEGVEPRREEARVHPEHKDRAKKFADRAHRQSGVFIVVMAFAPLWVVVPLVLAEELTGAGPAGEYWVRLVAGVLLVFLGLFGIRFPFATTQTVEWFGMSDSILLARITAGVSVAIGASMIGVSLL